MTAGERNELIMLLEKYMSEVMQANAQKRVGKSIFGGGLLLSEKAAAEKAAAEKAAAEKWKLSDREWEIVRRLG